MKRLIASVLSLSVGATQAQMSLACQYKPSVGYEWKDGNWQSYRDQMRSIKRDPFFLLIQQDNKIDSRSALVAMGIMPDIASMFLASITCFTHQSTTVALSSSCATLFGDYIIVSLETFEGALSSVLGSAMDKRANRHNIYVMPFDCKKM